MTQFFFQAGTLLNALAMALLMAIFLVGPYRNYGRVMAGVLGFTSVATAWLLSGNGSWTVGPVSLVQWGYVLSLGGMALTLIRANISRGK